MNPTNHYTRADIVRWLGTNEVRKGESYISHVNHLQVTPDAITARVQGTARVPYEITLQLSETPGGLSRLDDAYCTCPVGYECKHAAAVLLAALAQRDRPMINSIDSAVLAWASQAREALAAEVMKSAKPSTDTLIYVLRPRYSHNASPATWSIEIRKGRLSDQLDLSRTKPWNNVERALLQPPQFVHEDDLPLLRLLWLQSNRDYYQQDFPLTGKVGDETLRRALALGRLYDARGRVLHAGAPRTATLEWGGEAGNIRPLFRTRPPAEFVLGTSLWYLDDASGEVGPAETPCSGTVLQQLLALPPLTVADLPIVANVLREAAPELSFPAGSEDIRTLDVPPVPMLELGTLVIRGSFYYRYYDPRTKLFDYAIPGFRYGDVTLKPDDMREFFTDAAGHTLRIVRHFDQEKQRLKEIAAHNLNALPKHMFPQLGAVYGLPSEAYWPGFIADAVHALRTSGWQIAVPEDFRHRVLEVDDWQAEISENQGGWFDLDLGIVVAGERLSLAPLLFSLFRRDARWLDAAQLDAIADSEMLLLNGLNGERIQAPAGRIKPLARTLIDLFDVQDVGPLKLSKLDTPRLADLAENAHWQWHGAQHALDMAARIRHGHGVQACTPPLGLTLQLRPYQLEGLAWLQYLREQGLAGILADDMGLGKTAQTLAHLLLEKENGRLDKPALVVLPTSLIFNWKCEAARFAPDLRVLSLHGKDRTESFANIPHHDVVLTTYPLLWRDEEVLAEHEYHLLILDEAQTVKNAAAKSAQVVRKLRARHRLCLTGTPLENHLGELWAQFDFLLPGFLGEIKAFTRTWRTPIEKHGDPLRRDLLARRIKPFILRRRKEDVAKELPPKTIIVRTVELEGGQRDLYETVRSAMDKRVRDEIASKGFARSHIVILDALLKLRQACCDPRLLKLEAAKKVKERAKLDLLMEMLPELVEEGRRVLVFSQFTTMLALMEEELARLKLACVKLTGSTQDRESVIQQFQVGAVPVFLISLKAGGVGLNLTAADTVIHFDPWWNPAAENQATDRAHRIGQSKNVFVYKLVVAGSIEEKILAMQDRKAHLAASVLSEDADGLAKFGADDLSALLAPLPDK